jgi:hypothetical protein
MRRIGGRRIEIKGKERRTREVRGSQHPVHGFFVFCGHFSIVHHESSEASLGALEQTWMLSLLG